MSTLNKEWKSCELLRSKCQIKTKKCQPAARDTTDLIQTDGVPDSGLSRPKIKISERKKLKYKNVKKVENKSGSNCSQNSCYIKTKKCQPAARDTTDLIQTDGVPDSGLSRPKIKISERKNKIKKERKSWMEIGRKAAETCHSWKLSILLCTLLTMNGLLLEAWKLTLVNDHSIPNTDYILPEDWPGMNNFWKSNDLRLKSGYIAHMCSHKKWNKLQKVINGNRSTSQQLKVLHWNLGARKWHNKIEDINNLLNEYKPDLCYISEANLWEGLEAHQTEIQNHYLVLPLTMNSQKHARIVLIVKDTITVTRLDRFMSDSAATIWVRIGDEGRKSIRICRWHL